MKFLLKVLAAPIIAVLTAVIWLCVGIVYCASVVMGLAAWVVAFVGVFALLTVSIPQGIILLVIAFLLSPLGLPMVAIRLLGKVQDLRYFIQDAVF